MTIESVSGAGTVAMVGAIVFIVITRSWQLVSRTLGSRPSFRDSIMREAAQRFRDELEGLSAWQATWLGASVVFAVVFPAAYTLKARELFDGYPVWQLKLLIAVLVALAGYACYRMFRTVQAGRRVRFVRDANIAVGHQLQRIASGRSRVYHDVATSAGVIDHVIVGQSGIYAINVIARRSLRRGTVSLTGTTIEFAPSGHTLPITDVAAKTARLEKEFRRLASGHLRVRSVIAIPGWDVSEQLSEAHLLVSERTLPMLRGWRDHADNLLNEDVEALQKALTALCSRSARGARARLGTA